MYDFYKLFMGLFFYKYNRYSLIALVERKNKGIYNKIISYKGDNL